MANVYRFCQVHTIYIGLVSIVNCMVYQESIPWIIFEFSNVTKSHTYTSVFS